MRLFYAGDIHGSERCFRKFLNAAAFYNADLLILGGDITGKLMTPIIEEKRGRWTARFAGRTENVKREDDLEDLEKRIRFNGFYPYRCDRGEYERLSEDEEYLASVMTRVMTDEVRRWMQIADDKLAGTNVRCLIMPGNDDEFVIDELLVSESVENPDGKVIRTDGYQVLSCSWANPTPWDSPREASEEQLAEMLENIAVDLDPDIPAIFNLHVPPYDSGLDIASELDAEFHVVTTGGQPNQIPVGSTAVRRLIAERHPLLGLHGHIHESRNVATIDGTLCINPGSNYADGVLDGAIIDLDNGRIAQYQLVSG